MALPGGIAGGGGPAVNLDGSINTNVTDPTTGTAARVNEDGQLHIVAAGHLATENSTTTPLLANETFTGTAHSLLSYNGVSLMAYSDQDSAILGLKIQFSMDGLTNWRTGEEYTVNAGEVKWFTPPSFGVFYRVIYTNGPVNQTEFELATVLHKMPIKWSSHNINEPISPEDDAELVKAVLTGLPPSGTFKNILATEDGDLSISDNSNGLSIARGNVTGASNTNKFGNAPDFDTTDGEVDVWDGADDGNENLMTYTFSSTADIDRISSSNNGDTQLIQIQGLDVNYNEVIQTIALTGQTPAPLTTALIRVFRMKNVGSNNLAGRAYCFVNGTTTGGVPDNLADVRAIIDNGNNQTEMAIYTVPAGKTAYIGEIYASTAGASRITNYIIKLKVRQFGEVFQLKHRRSIRDEKDLEKKFDTPEVALEKSDIIMTAEVVATGITEASVSAGFDIILIDN